MYNRYGYGYDAALGAYAAILGLIFVLILAWVVVNIIASWKIFTKASQPGWGSIIPFYSNYIERKIFWGNGWLFLVPIICGLLNFLPFIGKLFSAIVIVFSFMTSLKKAETFGESVGFAFGLFLLAPIFNMILAFGGYQYRGVPQDGTSYDQLWDYYNKRKAAKNTAPTMQYEQPTQKVDNVVAPESVPTANYVAQDTASETSIDTCDASSVGTVDN